MAVPCHSGTPDNNRNIMYPTGSVQAAGDQGAEQPDAGDAGDVPGQDQDTPPR